LGDTLFLFIPTFNRKSYRRDSAPIPSLAELLERAGFHVKGRRADCVFCDGSSRLTVSFTNEVWHCFRCGRKGDVRTLARELGLALEPIARQILERREKQEAFKEWLHTTHMILVRHWWYLTRRAALAKVALQFIPDFEPAWCALANYCHAEAVFGAAFEFLSCEKLPR
jgi:hypothetical protein